MKFYKILNENECHHGLSYKTGLNIDPLEFRPIGNCQPGGIYFSREDILSFLSYGPWIREVTLPEGARLYREPKGASKWKADRVILGERRRISDEVINELIAEGANVGTAYLSWVVREKRTELLRPYLDRAGYAVLLEAISANSTLCAEMLLDQGLKPCSEMVEVAIIRGNVELTKRMIHVAGSHALHLSVLHNQIEIVKLFLDNGIRDRLAIFHAVRKDYMDIAKMLAPFGTRLAIRFAKLNGYMGVAKVLNEIL